MVKAMDKATSKWVKRSAEVIAFNYSADLIDWISFSAMNLPIRRDSMNSCFVHIAQSCVEFLYRFLCRLQLQSKLIVIKFYR